MGCGYSRSTSSSDYSYGEEYDARCIRSAEATLRQAEKDASEEYVMDDNLVVEITFDLQEARLALQHAYKPTMVAAATKKIAELEHKLEMLSPAIVKRQRLARVAKAKSTLEETKRDVQLNRERRALEEKMVKTCFVVTGSVLLVVVTLLRAFGVIAG